MNPQLLKDPVVLICCGIIFLGLVVLLWAIGKFRRLGEATSAINAADDLLSSSPSLPDINFRTTEASASPVAPIAPAVSKEVADRLENMTQRLSEMQSVLMKQSAAASAPGGAAGGAGAVGQGFSPETIDKLLKIIGNVIQQVDVLQKSIEPPK
jgi:hypothetical protein